MSRTWLATPTLERRDCTIDATERGRKTLWNVSLCEQRRAVSLLGQSLDVLMLSGSATNLEAPEQGRLSK